MDKLADGNEAVALFKSLVAIPSPSGRESATANKIVELLDELGYPSTKDHAGNVLVELEGEQGESGPLVCYASHMDEIGFTVTGILPDGRLKAIRRGGLFPWKSGESPVDVLTKSGDTIRGVISMGAGHKLPANHGITWENVTIITGLSPEALEERGVTVGSPGVYARELCGPYLLGDPTDPLIAAWTFDDRMGCVTLLRLLKALKERGQKPASRTLIAFTTREEVGGFGAKYLSMQRKPDLFIAVDGSPMPPEAGLNLQHPALWEADRLLPYDHDLAQALLKAGNAVGVKIQKAAYDVSASDASLAAFAGGTPRIACFGHPRENSHGYEVARLAVFDEILAVLIEFVTNWHE